MSVILYLFSNSWVRKLYLQVLSWPETESSVLMKSANRVQDVEPNVGPPAEDSQTLKSIRMQKVILEK